MQVTKITRIITLDHPVTVGNKEYTELSLREPIVNEVITSFKTMGKKSNTIAFYDAQITLVSKVSGLPVAVLEELSTRIVDEAIEYIVSFQNSSPDTETTQDQWDMDLEPPLQLSGEDGDVIDTLSLKEPTVKQRKMAMKQLDLYEQSIVGGLEFQLSLLTQVTEQKMAVILQLPISQFMQASSYLMRFFPTGQTTGENLGDN